MNHVDGSVTDLVADQVARPPSVEQRIQRRIEVLREWLEAGIPLGKALPTGLTAAREWEDKELGIRRIASPNEFTTTHHLHGRLVASVSGLLTDLRNKYTKPSARRRSTDGGKQSTKFDRQAFEDSLTNAVSQWHTERDKNASEKKRADSAEALCAIYLEEINQRDAVIAGLRAELAERRGLRAVE